MTHTNDSSQNNTDARSNQDTQDTQATTAQPKVLVIDGAPGASLSLAAALGGTPLDLNAGQSFSLYPIDLAAELAAELPESNVPFVEPDPHAGEAGMTVFNGLPSPIVCVEIDLATGQTVRVTRQESIEQLRAFAAAARQSAPAGHLVLEHPPAADTLTQELAQAQIEFSRNRSNLPKVDTIQPPSFI